MSIHNIKKRLRELGDPERAAVQQRFFKTGPGEYGEGDVFVGIRVPVLRKLSKEFGDLPFEDVLHLLKSEIHEARHVALFIMVRQYGRVDRAGKKRIYTGYLRHTRYVNNWDLVDCSAEHIVGAQLMDRNRGRLYRLAASENLWERRIAIMATFHFIKRQQFDETLKLAKVLMGDDADLIQKAVGWMLREVGKRGGMTEAEVFIKTHYRRMPRTMLRYAIERYPEQQRQRILKGTY